MLSCSRDYEGHVDGHDSVCFRPLMRWRWCSTDTLPSLGCKGFGMERRRLLLASGEDARLACDVNNRTGVSFIFAFGAHST